MSKITHVTDANANVTLPMSFANTTVIIEQVSDEEVIIRKAEITSEEKIIFREEIVTPLSDRDRDCFLEMLDNPPPPNDVLMDAVRRYKEKRG